METIDFIEIFVFTLLFSSLVYFLRKSFPEVDFQRKINKKNNPALYRKNTRQLLTLLLLGLFTSYYFKDIIMRILKKYLNI